MASYFNKFANSVTNATGSLIGREHLAKLTNSINQAFVQAKYKTVLNSGNIVQIISKHSLRALQICMSQDKTLVLFGNGQIGEQYESAHFKLYVDPRNGHLVFSNHNNYIGIDSNLNLAVLQEPNSKKKKDQLGSRVEFRLHSIVGSEEYFALESIYCTGRYLSVSQDGIVSFSKNKTTADTYFSAHLIKEFIQAVYEAVPSASAASASIPPERPPPPITAASYEPPQPQTSTITSYEQEEKEKEIEDKDAPPNYTSLFPKLPPS